MKPTIEQAISIVGKELGFKKHFAEKQIKRFPSQEKRIRGEVAAMEFGLQILKEVRDKQAFIKLEAIKQ